MPSVLLLSLPPPRHRRRRRRQWWCQKPSTEAMVTLMLLLLLVLRGGATDDHWTFCHAFVVVPLAAPRSQSSTASWWSPPPPPPPLAAAPDTLDWVVVQEYVIPVGGVDLTQLTNSKVVDESTTTTTTTKTMTTTATTTTLVQRLDLSRDNVTVPVALQWLDPDRFPSLSKARKACRQGKIAVRMGAGTATATLPLENDEGGGRQTQQRAKVGDRVHPLDRLVRLEARHILEREVAAGEAPDSFLPFGGSRRYHNYYEVCSLVEPRFHLPIIYEDDYMAIVNKPAGVLVYPENSKGRNNIVYALPYVLRRPTKRVGSTIGNRSNDSNDHDDDDDVILDRPIPVHRLDFATSGLLVVGKTKRAVRYLSQQFEFRKAQKTYTAMLFGIPKSQDTSSSKWNLAESEMDGKNCTTWWRIVDSYHYQVPTHEDDAAAPVSASLSSLSSSSSSSSSTTVPISIVELKPETGRYHQLRRQMAFLYQTPIVGDPIYARPVWNETSFANTKLGSPRYHRGLMLCSNRIAIAHPFFNTETGRQEWEQRKNALNKNNNIDDDEDTSSFRLYEDSHTGTVMVEASVEVPKKFEKFQRLLNRMSNASR